MADNELVPYSKKGKKGGSGIRKCEPLQKGDLTPVLDLVLTACTNHMGRPCYYPDTKEGLDDFINKTIDFFEYVETVNSNEELDEKQKLIVDIELWATFLGLSRKTIWQYEQRGGEWSDVIGYYKNIIGTVKKQMALHNKIPSLVYLFDSTNNHGYVNSNEFKLSDIKADTRKDSIDEQARKSDLIWNELKGRYEPLEG